MRYDVRTCMMGPDEPQPHVPGWPDLVHPALGKPGYRYDLRIGDAERDAAMTQLREHFAAGRLTLDELTERIDCTLAAKTESQLEAIMADLPQAPKRTVPAARSADSEVSDTGRYVVLLLLLFALAAWLLMMAYMASRAYPPYPPYGGR
jgi:hypothetical protein